ncbi:putative amine oxidase [copper-containing] [Physella acuta]|uniref:putative amine oxidase [copper-containing] n=1 Tax=Physella acuta TaxID=109671 RepID=UPI0027DCF731|nr:putative amine oxidase [copper-containing] [Physella acuta]
MWLFGIYSVMFYSLHPIDFAVYCDVSGSDPSQWRIEKVWYAGRVYDTVDQLVDGYKTNTIPKVKVTKPRESPDLFSTLYRRGQPVPERPQRAPVQVEPDGKRYSLRDRKVRTDGKRYSLKDRKVEYMGWTFNFRMSALTGPSLYDVRFKGERIAYELGLAEISVFYSGGAPLSQITNYVDSGVLLGSHSKSMVPGADCPEFSTLVNQTFWSQHTDVPGTFDASFCLFEFNNGYPLRRHSSYESDSGLFYGGMLDSVLILRSALTIGNYDYVIDFEFHQNGVIEVRLMSTGYIQTSFYSEPDKPYGFRLQNTITGNIHHHMAHFKVDLDIGGPSNRYETLDILPDAVPLKQDPSVTYNQMKFRRTLVKTEREAVYDYNFTRPMYHVVHSRAGKTKFGLEVGWEGGVILGKTKFGEIKAYRIQMNGMSYNLLPRDQGNEGTIPWARHQMVVTRHKDDEIWSSSNYAMFDGLDPVVNFTKFYQDDESIVDQDLVFWMTCGMHHIPHTEDLPNTPTVGNHLTFYLLPYNYFDECPSVSSRDSLHIIHRDRSDTTKGVFVDRNGNSRDQCLTPRPNLEELLEENPDLVLESRRQNFIY